MKIQRKIAALLCCLVFMGMFSLDALSAQAAACSHERCFEVIDTKAYYFEEDGHYREWGSSFICAKCGYQYWDDTTLRYEKIGYHEYSAYTLMESTDERDVYISDCTTPECPYQDIRIYIK